MKTLLKNLKSKEVLKYIRGKEDLISPGTPLCPGCPVELSLRFSMKIFGRDTYLFAAPSCGVLMMAGYGTDASMKSASAHCLMTNVPSMMTGTRRYLRKIGKNSKVVGFVGDGSTVDVGFQPLSGAAERGENVLYICYDNEGYMNTGIQRSGSTPYHGWTFTSPTGGSWKGKPKAAKHMPHVMLMHEIAYVATACISFPEDYAKKLTKALEVKDGMSYIHLLTPCPTGWRFPPELSIDMGRLAVETNYFPLWEAENGRVRMTYEITEPRPVEEFTKPQGRFRHFDKAMLDEFQGMVDRRHSLTLHLSKFDG